MACPRIGPPDNNARNAVGGDHQEDEDSPENRPVAGIRPLGIEGGKPGCRRADEIGETEGAQGDGQGFNGLAGGPKDAFDEALDQAAGEARTIVLKAAKGLTAK